jgi:hypothetical protein
LARPARGRAADLLSPAHPAAIGAICTLDPMAIIPGRRQPAVMNRLGFRSQSRRDADNELYDYGCDLVEAAAEIRRAADTPQATPAVPALLGCIEAALYELSCASTALQQATDARCAAAPDATTQAVAARLRRGYANLATALEDARAAARAARSLAARSRGASRGRSPW